MPSHGYNEADTRAKLIDPALHTACWIERVGESERDTHGEIHREQSHRREAEQQRERATGLRDGAKALRKADLADEADRKLSTAADAERSARDALAKAQGIEDAAYDLKAVNPREKKIVDQRAPAQLLEAIALKGREVDAALEKLRALVDAA